MGRWQAKASPLATHVLSEPLSSSSLEDARWPIDTPGGRFYAEWDAQAPVSREGQLMFLFQFLEAADRWKSFLADCPLHYFGNRGSGSLSVMGTALLSILRGHWSYAHVNSVRGDSVNAGLLGMGRIVSEDVVRTGLKRMEEQRSLEWARRHIIESISPALILPWILDID